MICFVINVYKYSDCTPHSMSIVCAPRIAQLAEYDTIIEGLYYESEVICRKLYYEAAPNDIAAYSTKLSWVLYYIDKYEGSKRGLPTSGNHYN